MDISLLDHTTDKNGHAIIQVSGDGENSIFIYPGSNGMVTTNKIDNVLENVIEEVPVTENTVKLNVSNFEIVTLLIK